MDNWTSSQITIFKISLFYRKETVNEFEIMFLQTKKTAVSDCLRILSCLLYPRKEYLNLLKSELSSGNLSDSDNVKRLLFPSHHIRQES